MDAQPETATESPEFMDQLVEGKQVMDQVNEQIQQFQIVEQEEETRLKQTLDQQQQFTGVVLAVAVIIGIGGSLLAAYLSYRLEHHLQKSDRRWRESEARYRAVVENFPNGAVLLFNHELRYLLADGSGLASVSLSKPQLEGKTIWECLPTQTCTQLEPLYRQVLAGETVTREMPFGDRIFIIHALPLRNQTGELMAGMAVTQDITELKQSEQELYHANRALRTLSECNQALVLATDEITLLHHICQIIVDFGGYRCAWIGFAQQDQAKTVHPFAQAGYEKGYEEDEIANHLDEWSKRVHPDDLEWVMGMVQDHFDQKTPYYSSEHRVLCKDGSYKWILDRGQALWDEQGTVVRMVGSHTDISDRKAAEAALRDSEARFRAMFERSKAIKLLIDSETGAIADANWAAVKFYGYSRSQLITKTITDFNCLPPAQVQAEMRRAKLEERTYFVFPHRLASGEIREVEVYSSPIEIQGRTFLVSIIHDITERKQAERALQDSEERFRAIFEQASVGIALTTPSG
ncbi:MAG: PAS domain S-box protein [Coleofasciculus sp. F4-SAH-05]